MRSFGWLQLLFAGEEARQLLEGTSYFAFFVTVLCGDSGSPRQISRSGQTPFLCGWESIEHSWKVVFTALVSSE